jgi:hypothetical protein
MIETVSENLCQDFENGYCKFKPFDWQEIDGVLRPILFKVVTDDLKSLGLRKNPNIMQFSDGEWTALSEDELLATNKDWGGIWSTLKLSGAKTLSKYISSQYNKTTKTFLVALDTPLYANSYRVKSKGVFLLSEININTSERS